jgi:hypothetical protein
VPEKESVAAGNGNGRKCRKCHNAYRGLQAYYKANNRSDEWELLLVVNSTLIAHSWFYMCEPFCFQAFSWTTHDNHCSSAFCMTEKALSPNEKKRLVVENKDAGGGKGKKREVKAVEKVAVRDGCGIEDRLIGTTVHMLGPKQITKRLAS